MDPTQAVGSLPLPYPDESRGPLMEQVLWSLISISTVVVAARVWIKLSKVRRLYTDDIWMVLSLLFGLVHASLLSRAIDYGLGRHMLYLDVAEIVGAMKYSVLSQSWAFLSPMAGRVSFCITMLYISGTDVRVTKWAKYTTVAFLIGQIIANIVAFIVFYAQCGTRIELLWAIDPSEFALRREVCMDVDVQKILGYGLGAFNCLTDAYMTILPAILIEHSRLSLKRKIGLAFLLCLSVLALAAAIVKTYEAKALSEVSDYSYELCEYVIWIAIELNVVIIVSSIPLLRPLLNIFRTNKPHRLPPERSRTSYDDTKTFSSVFSKGHKSRTRSAVASTSSEENIILPQGSREQEVFCMDHRPGGQPGITVTTEVEVTSHQASDVQFVHAALVGLVQGELGHRPNTRQVQQR